MIVGQQKTISEIRKTIAPYDRILIMGCGTCVKTCFAGGEDEVAVLASSLRLACRQEGKKIAIEEITVERQCENEFIMEASHAVKRNRAILSLGCGAGVQSVARRFQHLPVLPGLNTSFIGVLEKSGLFTEECSACGDCKLAIFGAICPVTRCAKKLMNGPCGGSKNGKCEVDPEADCAWHLIIERLTALGQLENLNTFIRPLDWSGYGYPRKVVIE